MNLRHFLGSFVSTAFAPQPDGTEDLENEHGSWRLQNLQTANSLN
jgi:hypothetical protein